MSKLGDFGRALREAGYNPRTEHGDGKSKSNGHLAFVGKWEYWIQNGEIYRASPNVTYIDSRTGYRSGGRSQGRASQWGPDLYQMYGFNQAQIAKILPGESFQGKMDLEAMTTSSLPSVTKNAVNLILANDEEKKEALPSSTFGRALRAAKRRFS